MENSYWTKAGLDAKKTLQAQKILVVKNGIHHYRHPKLNEISFEKKEINYQEKTREERRQEHLLKRKERKSKLENIPFSSLHNKLVNKTYSTRTDSFKKAALEAAHENRIQDIIRKTAIYRTLKTFERNAIKPNLLIVNTIYDHKISTFMTIPSSLSLETLYKIGRDMCKKLQISMKNFFNIEIWEKENYLEYISGKLATPRYTVYKDPKQHKGGSIA